MDKPIEAQVLSLVEHEIAAAVRKVHLYTGSAL